jgi:adenine-specific DNA-methyltransferase
MKEKLKTRSSLILPAVANGLDPIRLLARPATKLLGAYYTADLAAEFMARWAIRTAQDRVLEPCFGDGAFLRSIIRTSLEKGFQQVKVFGVEMAEAAFRDAVSSGTIVPENAIMDDFLKTRPFPVDVVVGNPPYVRLRHLPASQANGAMRIAREALGEPMRSSGSVWMPFILHALQFLVVGGRLAFVLPYDMTYVQYARPLWHYLGKKFSSLHVLRIHERLFPDIMQDVLILCADGFGGTTNTVRFRAFERKADFISGNSNTDEELPISAIVNGDRPFVRALLSNDLRELLDDKLAKVTYPIREVCSFNIGYVSAHKTFFHPSQSVIDEFRIPNSSLRPAVASSRQLSGVGVLTSSIDQASQELLFYPQGKLSRAEQRYIQYGESLGVDQRYKCRNRKPWYKVPDVRVPDLILSVFGERPVMLWNDKRLVATNSLLCGFVRQGSPEALLEAWYTSLGLLYCELHVHSLGGGVFVLVPRETGDIRVPRFEALPKKYLSDLNRIVRRLGTEKAYSFGDETILNGKLGLNDRDLDVIRQGIFQLRWWRAPNGDDPTRLSEDVNE